MAKIIVFPNAIAHILGISQGAYIRIKCNDICKCKGKIVAIKNIVTNEVFHAIDSKFI